MCGTKLDWLVLIKIEGVEKTRIDYWGINLPIFSKELRTWGEAGVVKTTTDTTSKLYDRGVTCMMFGYTIDHGIGVYRI